jgi:hypothetical protein
MIDKLIKRLRDWCKSNRHNTAEDLVVARDIGSMLELAALWRKLYYLCDVEVLRQLLQKTQQNSVEALTLQDIIACVEELNKCISKT